MWISFITTSRRCHRNDHRGCISVWGFIFIYPLVSHWIFGIVLNAGNPKTWSIPLGFRQRHLRIQKTWTIHSNCGPCCGSFGVRCFRHAHMFTPLATFDIETSAKVRATQWHSRWSGNWNRRELILIPGRLDTERYNHVREWIQNLGAV